MSQTNAMRRVLSIAALAVALAAAADPAAGASLALRRAADGSSQFPAQLGERVDLEVVIDAGTEEVTGVALYLSFPSEVFRVVPTGSGAPFIAGSFLGGIELVNRSEQIGDETFLDYTEAAGKGERQGGTGVGVVARFQLEIVRRPVGNLAWIRLESRGHDRVCHYLVVAEPGVEKRFTAPLGEAGVRISGFRILPLPDLTLVEGESRVVFDLDAFVDTTVANVLWTNSQLSEVPTTIDPRTREVTMSPPSGRVGQWAMIFTAFEASEGLTAADTVRIRIVSRPRITAFPDTVRFLEDTVYRELDLDAYVEDLDNQPAELTWTAKAGGAITVSIDPGTHIASFSAPPDYFGGEELTLVVTDPSGLSDSTRFRVEVLPVNDPPEGKVVPPVYPVVGAPPLAVPLASLVTDRDDPLSNLSFVVTAEAGVQAQVSDTVLLLRGEVPGRAVVTLTATDTSGASATARQVAVVLPAGNAVAPEIDRLPELRLRGGQTGSLDLTPWVHDDAPVAELTWRVEPGPGLTALVLNGVLQVGGRSGFAGVDQVRLTAVDRDGNTGTGVLPVVILRPEDGLGPAVYDPGKIGIRVAEGGVVLPLDRWVSDPDDKPAQIAWTVEPSAGLAYDPQTRELSLAAGDSLVQPAAVSLTARDPSGRSDQVTVPVLVAAPDGPPQTREFPQVSLDSLGAEIRLDLDEFAFDAKDAESELVWTALAEPGVTATVDPVSHLLRLRRSDPSGRAPLFSQVLLRVEDTDGLVSSRILLVGLPPLFTLRPLPEIQLVAGRPDTSLVLDSYVTGATADLVLSWSVVPGVHVSAVIDPTPHRVRLSVGDPAFEGTEILTFTATDQTGRSLTAGLRVVVQGKGLVPQLRDLPAEVVVQGQNLTSIRLDDYVVDDDPDSVLQWTVSGQQTLQVAIDPATRVVTLLGGAATPGVEHLRFLVRDPAGNVASGMMEVTVVRGGSAPVVGPLPQIILLAGGPEGRLDLSAFVVDPDTPVGQLTWAAAASAGLAARLEGAQLVVSVPAGEHGSRTVQVTATDPQGNRGQAELTVLIDEDDQPPVLALEVTRHPVFSELLQVRVTPSEELSGAPTVWIDSLRVPVEAQEGGGYVASFSFPPQDQSRTVEIQVEGTDRGGNVGRRHLSVALAWMDDQGGNLTGPDPQVLLNVSQAATGPGHLAVLYRLGDPELPAGSGTGPVYAVDLLRGRSLPQPVTVNFFVGQTAAADLGILRWDSRSGTWTELPTLVDRQRGWLSAVVDTLGLFRLGPVSAAVRQLTPEVLLYPNPFIAREGGQTRLVYQVSLPGPVRLELFNVLGQRVALLVDEFQEVGSWSAQWDGRDAAGLPLAVGVYLYRLSEGGRQHRGRLVLIR